MLPHTGADAMHPLKGLVLAIVLLLPLGATGLEAQTVRVTRSGYIFCTTLEKFREQSSLRVSGDQAAWRSFMENQSNGCAVLREGIRVYVESAGIRNLGVMRIRPEGTTVWFYTNSEAVPSR